jgi:hypothetical protein
MGIIQVSSDALPQSSAEATGYDLILCSCVSDLYGPYMSTYANLNDGAEDQ